MLLLKRFQLLAVLSLQPKGLLLLQLLELMVIAVNRYRHRKVPNTRYFKIKQPVLAREK